LKQLTLAALLCVALAGCVDRVRDPLSVFTADPKAFTFWVMPF
jgi:hypothetical protein